MGKEHLEDYINQKMNGKNKNFQFSGKRTFRGLYKSKDEILINADVNGASNIIKKVFPHAFDKITDFTYLTETVNKLTIK